VRLSLEIIVSSVGASVVLDAGAALVASSCEMQLVQPGSENTAKVRDGSSRNLRDPSVDHVTRRTGPTGYEAPGSRACLLFERASDRTRTCGQHVDPHRETISGRAKMGSRSVAIVPMNSGNPVLGDSKEGRATPCEQNRRWETRRAL
jgi:hypothetical protein